MRPTGRLHVLCVQRRNDIIDRKVDIGHAVDIQPDSHGVILGTEYGGITHALRALHTVEHVDRGKVRQKQRIMDRIVRCDRDHQQRAEDFFLMLTPARETSSGNDDMASATRFCTFTALISGSVPGANVTCRV